MSDQSRIDESSPRPEHRKNDSVQLVVFQIENRALALPLTRVAQVLRMAALTPVPDAPAWWLGVINLGGVITPVIDLRTRLGFPPRAPGLSARIIIVRLHARNLGLVADVVSDVTTVRAQDIGEANMFGESSDLVVGIARVGDRPVLVLDLEKSNPGFEKSE